MKKYSINDRYNNFKDFTLNIKKFFEKEQENIHKARNELKIISFDGIDTVVKSFKVPNIINKLVYSFFRDSKAKKSYEYSLKIGKFTPTPISYIEFYENGLLSNSYFISERFNYDFTIREPLVDKDFDNKEEIFKQFAKFTFDLHENGILHQDYSPGNILIKNEDEDNYIFKIVDINRMEFKELDLDTRLKNFAKLWAKDEDLKIIVEQYAKILGENIDFCIDTSIKFSQEHKDKKNLKKRLKGKKVVD